MRHLALTGLLLVAACAPSISTVNINPPPRPLTPRGMTEVEIYTTKLPARRYVEVAVFTASKGKAEDHLDAIRERAANYGCDALVFTRMPSQSTSTSNNYGTQPGQPGSMSTTESVGSSLATCAVWNDLATGTEIEAPAPPAAATTPAGAPM